MPPNIGQAIQVLRGQLGGGLPASALPGVMPTKPMPGVPGGAAGVTRPPGPLAPQPVTGGGLQAAPAPLTPQVSDVLPMMPTKAGDGGPGAEQLAMAAPGLAGAPGRYARMAETHGPEFAAQRWQDFQAGNLPGQRVGQQPQTEVLQADPGGAMGSGPQVNPQAAAIAQRLQAMTGGGLQGGGDAAQQYLRTLGGTQGAPGLNADGNAGGWNQGAMGAGQGGDVAARRAAINAQLAQLMRRFGGGFPQA